MKELINIQSELKAAKTHWNAFSKYYFRSAEDILESVKPLLKSNNCYLTLSDEIVEIGARYYVKATATLKSGEDSVSVTAYAREEEVKKGYDCAQITGAASSYARKYALNGLLCIDDARDPDNEDNTQQKTPSKAKAPDDIESDLKQAKEAIDKCKNAKDLLEVWNTFTNLQGVAEFKKALSDGKKKLGVE